MGTYKTWNGGSGVGSKSNIEKLAKDYVNSNYDKFTKGDEYAALEKRYSEAGRKAADDTMGIAAARTGGLASSYAVSAGAQAYGGYMERLEDAARSLYDSQMAEKANKLGVAQELYDRQYGEWQDAEALGEINSEDEHNIQEKAYQKIHNLLAVGTPIYQIDPELITLSGYDASYWNLYAAAMGEPETLDFDADEIVEQLEGGNVNPSTLATYRKLYGRSYADVMIENETFKELSEEQLAKRVNDLKDAGDADGADALYDAWYGYLYEVAESLGLSAEDLLAQMKADKE